jgi:hypothetical protein
MAAGRLEGGMATDDTELPFQSLDYIYTPSKDVAVDVAFFTDIIGGRLIFAVEGMGARVAMVELTDGPPPILLADHLAGEKPILVYRVPDFDAALADLEQRGWTPERTLEIPFGPCASFHAPGGQRIAIYAATRPEVERHFAGRRDF